MLEREASVDSLEQELFELGSMESRIAARRSQLIRALDAAQVATADGCRSMSDWVASRLDVGPETARKLVKASRALSDLPFLSEQLEAGLVSFDRVHELAQLSTSEDEEHIYEESRIWDISGLRRQVADRRRLSSEDERRLFDDRYVVLQPSLDEGWWKLWGGLPGAQGAVVEKALQERADSFPVLPDGSRPRRSAANADALVSLAEDSLTGGTASDDSPDRATSTISVFVDASQASNTSGETGARIEAGPRVGPDALKALLCGAQVEVTAVGEHGVPLGVGNKFSVIPPRLKRFVLFRDGGCVVDGCSSRYRLQAHHIEWKSHGGSDDPDNLISLCWYHHQVVIHRMGFRVDPDTPRTRVRLLKPERGPP